MNSTKKPTQFLNTYLSYFLPDIEPVYMSEKNSNHGKEIDDN